MNPIQMATPIIVAGQNKPKRKQKWKGLWNELRPFFEAMSKPKTR